jgi:hypothetical protein
MCGDYCCPSCGPAQGNWRCIICNAWASDACEHVSEEGEGYRPGFLALAQTLARQQAGDDDALARELEAGS